MVYHGLRYFVAGHAMFHIHKGIGLLGLLALGVTTGGGQLQKTEHPLSPTVAVVRFPAWISPHLQSLSQAAVRVSRQPTSP